MSSPDGTVTALLTGVAVGWFLAFRFARAVERFRRYRQDLRGTMATVRNLWAGTRHEGLRMVRIGLVVAGIAVVATEAVLHVT